VVSHRCTRLFAEKQPQWRGTGLKTFSASAGRTPAPVLRVVSVLFLAVSISAVFAGGLTRIGHGSGQRRLADGEDQAIF
jgi:hypothetical protein